MKVFFQSLVVAILLCVCQDLIAQAPPGDGSSPPCWPPPCIPIDGGLGFLAAAGIALGVKVLYDKKNN